MKKKIFTYLAFTLLICTGIFLFLLFYPRKYNVPQLQGRKNIQYWTLPTGSRIAYTFIASKGAKMPYPVIYLHGGPGGFISDATVQRFLPLSEDGFDVYLYDQVGSGYSGRLENIEGYTADRHKRDLAEIIKKTGAEKVILIGQSWGAILATLYVADHPGRVEKLIFTGPGPVYPVRKELGAIVPPDSLHLKQPLYSNRQANEKIENLRSKTVFLYAKIFDIKLASDKEMDDFETSLSNETAKTTVCDTSKAGKAKGGAGYYVRIMTLRSLFEMRDPRPQLKNSPVPLFIMRGECDNQKWGYLTEYMELFPNHQLVVIPGAGHAISVEQPGLYLKTLRAFLHEQTPAPAKELKI
ncbi:MAG: alpha/beta hydrolase [Bacteroidetes bacterium]|nr:alpha/beta hydrolase [Bacteroidota bacterium]